MDETHLTKPLEHVRVLDLSRIMAGPWTGQLLADLGADVIKVERPGVGDDTRSWGPPFLRDANGAATNNSGYYLSVNRGKRSITVDLNTPDGQRIIRDLAARSDILLENFKVGTLARFGLGYDDLKSANPRLIYASISGFGQDGPRSQQAAYDFMIQAMGGLMSVTGEADARPGGGPQKVGVPIVDIMTGMYAAVAVLAALERRRESGGGDFIDIAMLDVQVSFLANQAMNFLLSGKAPTRAGNQHPNIQPQDVFQCSDGYLAIACGNDAQFARLVETLKQPSLATDERFRTNSSRVQNLAALRPLLAQELSSRKVAECVALLDAAGVPCGPIQSIPQVLADPQVVHRGMVREISDPLGRSVPQVVSPMRFRENPLAFDAPPPRLGQHTDEVLRELGLDEAAVEKLRSKGVV